MEKSDTPWFTQDRPLAVFDIESTGTSPRADRIIDLAVAKIHPDGKREWRTWRVNPGVPIPEEAARIHGIRDEDVADCPPFAQVAAEVGAFLEGCDLAGYNIVRFDVPLLQEEFGRAGVTYDIENVRLIDAQRIFHRKEPRDLTAALAFYRGEMHLDAHGAESDVAATISVLEGEFARYSDLPRDPDELHEFCNPRKPGWVDRTGRLKWVNRQVAINFGRRKGELLRDIVRNDPNYIKWMLRSDFPKDVRKIVSDAVDGTWPKPPEST